MVDENTEDKKNKKRILIYPIHGEVIPQRLWYALTDKDSPANNLYEISGFAGRPSKEKITQRLEDEIQQRIRIIKESEGTDRASNIPGIQKEMVSLREFIQLINNGTIPYYKLDDQNCTVPQKAYANCDCVFIGTNNLTHVKYVEDAIAHGKDFVCEKPYNVRLRDIRRAEQLEDKIKQKELVGKITCHFAHKPAFLKLIDNLEGLIKDHGKIKRFEGHYEEFDDPENPRTLATLDANQSGGGIYLDTGCHFYSMLFQLGANLESVVNGTEKFEWDSFGDYKTDTFARVNHQLVNGNGFSNADIEITVSKFAHKYEHHPKDKNAEPSKEEHKELILTFENGYTAHVLFSNGKVEIKNPEEIVVKTIEDNPNNYSKNEYANVLVDFYMRLTNGQPPYTLTDVGIKACKAITETYYDFKSDKTRIDLYQR